MYPCLSYGCPLFQGQDRRCWVDGQRRGDRASDLFGFAGLTIDGYSDSIVPLREANTFCIQTDINLLTLKDVQDRRGNVRILTPEEAGSHLDNGHFTSETSKHLCELEADVAASNDDKCGGR